MLYRLAKNGKKVAGDPDIQRLLAEAGLSKIPSAEVAVFVGNAWDPKPGRETPWIDVARQIADEGFDAQQAVAHAAVRDVNGDRFA